MTGTKTNERPGTKALARYIRMSPYKVREVLDLIRGQHVQRAAEILRFSEREAAFVVGKVLASAVANAEHNDGIDPEDLYVSACFADEGVTIKRFRPRARGRAGRIRKRTCHITVVVSRMPEDQLRRYRSKLEAEQAARRARRVAGGRAGGGGATAAEAAGRAGRFRRRRGKGEAAPATGGPAAGEADEQAAAGEPAAATEELSTEPEAAQVEAVEEVAAAGEEVAAEGAPEGAGPDQVDEEEGRE